MLPRRLERNARQEPTLATPRALPQRPDHVHGPMSRHVDGVLHVAHDAQPRGGEGLAHHGRVDRHALLGHGHEWHLVPGDKVAGSRVWRGGSSEGPVWGACRLVLGWVVVGDEETFVTQTFS